MDSLRPARHELAAAFTHPGFADSSQPRPPYPPAVFDVLEQLIADRPRAVLDIGTGEGALARPLAARVDHVDAVDISAAMIDAGLQRPGGQQRNLHWIVGAAETAELGGPYALVTAGASLHWMSWSRTLPRLARVMTDSAFLAIVDHGYHGVPWRQALNEVIARYSRDPGYDPAHSLVDALSASGLITMTGHTQCAPMSFRQLVASYVEQFHSTSTLAREWMSAQESAAFDRAIEDVVRPYALDDMLEMDVVAHVAWGRPTSAA